MMDREDWRAAVHGVKKNWTRLSNWIELNPTFILVFKHAQLACSHMRMTLLFPLQALDQTSPPQKSLFPSFNLSCPLLPAYCPKLSLLLPHFILLTRLISTCNDNIYLITHWLFLKSRLSPITAETLTALAPTSS